MAILKDLRLTVQTVAAKETAKTEKDKLVLGKFSATSAVTAATGFHEDLNIRPERDFTRKTLFLRASSPYPNILLISSSPIQCLRFLLKAFVIYSKRS